MRGGETFHVILKFFKSHILLYFIVWGDIEDVSLKQLTYSFNSLQKLPYFVIWEDTVPLTYTLTKKRELNAPKIACNCE